jgi:histidine ammonia-lyase
MPEPVLLTGERLDPLDLARIARGGAGVRIAEAARQRIRRAAEVVAAAAQAGEPVYGRTTALGHRVVEAVAPDELSSFSLRTLRGRATGVGAPLATEVVRGAIALRLNGLCAGGAGAGEPVADGLAALLGHDVHPIVPGWGSVGASDLCLMAHIGLVLVGEGEAEWGGERMAGDEALRRAGLSAISLAAKDGLALCSSSALSVAVAVLAALDAGRALQAAQASAALAMEGFRANLSPIDPRVVAARPAPGQEWSAAGLRELLAGGALTEPGAARRLQDPLSFRCVAPIHGSLHTALRLLGEALDPELGGAADNPLVIPDEAVILSTGNFHVPALALALDAVAVGLAQIAAPIAQRQARLKTERLSGLPQNLVTGPATRSGMGPLSKTAEALVIEIRQRAAPAAVHPTVSADGVEDDSTGVLQAGLRVAEQLERLWRLVALELIVAAEAVDLAGAPRLGAGTAVVQAAVREHVARLEDDRALGPEIERLAGQELRTGRLLGRLGR